MLSRCTSLRFFPSTSLRTGSPVGLQNDAPSSIGFIYTTALIYELIPKTQSPPGLGGLFSLYIQFSNFRGNSMLIPRRYFGTNILDSSNQSEFA